MFALLSVIIVSAPHSIFSPNHRFQAVVEYGQTIDLTVLSFTMLDEKGGTRYVKISPAAITFYVNDDGSVFATNETGLFYYDQAGRDTLLKRLEYPNGFGFSPDHALFFASDRQELAAYSPEGQLWQRFKPCRLFASADRGSVVATVTDDTLSIYHQGQNRYKIGLSTPYIHELHITPDGQRITLKEPDGTEAFDAITGEEMEAP